MEQITEQLSETHINVDEKNHPPELDDSYEESYYIEYCTNKCEYSKNPNICKIWCGKLTPTNDCECSIFNLHMDSCIYRYDNCCFERSLGYKFHNYNCEYTLKNSTFIKKK